MSYSKSFPAILTVALSGCGGLVPANNNALPVRTEPAGAEVFVFGESVGHTPMELPFSRVFPHTYPREKEGLYGHVILRKEGCVEQDLKVDTKAVAKGISRKLDCAGPKAAEGSPDVASRLHQLEALRQQGVITQEEYEQQRRRILDSL